MRWLAIPMLLGFLDLAVAAGAQSLHQAIPEIRVIDETGMPRAQLDALEAEFRLWAPRVYAYLQVEQPPPVRLVLTRRVRIGYYRHPTVYVPLSDADEMLETWVHELAHHATGHDSSFFFKEGIATHTLEELFAPQARVPQGFPQYGQSNDAWVELFRRRGELPSLATMMAMASYDASSREGDFRSWQVYIVAASFSAWLIRNEGYARFRECFERASLGSQHQEWERRWLADLRARPFEEFSAASFLPDRPRYRDYAERLSAGRAP